MATRAKIDFLNRVRKDKNDGRKKITYEDNAMGDFWLVINEIGLDNSMGDYYESMVFSFIETLDDDTRSQFQNHLQKHCDDLMDDISDDWDG